MARTIIDFKHLYLCDPNAFIDTDLADNPSRGVSKIRTTEKDGSIRSFSLLSTGLCEEDFLKIGPKITPEQITAGGNYPLPQYVLLHHRFSTGHHVLFRMDTHYKSFSSKRTTALGQVEREMNMVFWYDCSKVIVPDSVGYIKNTAYDPKQGYSSHRVMRAGSAKWIGRHGLIKIFAA